MTYNCVLMTTVVISNTRPANNPTSSPRTTQARQVATQMYCGKKRQE